MRSKLEFFILFMILVWSSSSAFQSDELLHDDEEFGLEGRIRSHDLDLSTSAARSPSARRRSSSDLDSSSPDSKLQFSLHHAFGSDPDFYHAGTFSARLKTLIGGAQTLIKLRFSRNTFTEREKEKFNKLLEDDDYYKIRLPSNVLSPPGKDYVISSIKARCLSRENLDEHIVIHMDGVNIIAVSYGSTGACQYPRPLKYPAKWSFNSYTAMKTTELAPRTPLFSEEALAGENGEGEGMISPERSFWSKYWIYLIPLGLIVMNAITQAMNLPEEQATGQSASQAQQVSQRPANPAIRRR